MGEKYRLNIPRLNVLSREKLELIHHSTLEVLRRTGVAVKEPEALEILKKGGCDVSGEFNFAPAETVCQDCIRASVEVAFVDSSPIRHNHYRLVHRLICYAF
jgi:trimethylamine:corrinoid methyltransferase-like protein